MLADDLAVAEIVMLMNEAVVEGFKVGMSYQRDSDGGKIGKFSGNGVSIDGKNPGAFVSPFVPAICFSGMKKALISSWVSEL
jgi:hypothetical protein